MSKETNLSLSFIAGFAIIPKLSTTDLSLRGPTGTSCSTTVLSDTIKETAKDTLLIAGATTWNSINASG
jgi:hypothetical protein